jgi:hypothetical protein
MFQYSTYCVLWAAASAARSLKPEFAIRTMTDREIRTGKATGTLLPKQDIRRHAE